MITTDPTLALFEHLVGAWHTGAAARPVQARLEEALLGTVDRLDVALLLDATHKGPTAIRKDGALRTALAKGPVPVALRVLDRMAQTKGWEPAANPANGTDRRKVHLQLLRRADEAQAVQLWDAAAPLLVDGRLQLPDGPWDALCHALGKGWLDLVDRIQTAFPLEAAQGQAPAWLRWSGTVRALRKHPIKVQRKVLGILHGAARATTDFPDGQAQVRGMGLGDLTLALRLQPSWATAVHATLHGAPAPQPGKAQEQDRAHLTALLHSAHGRLAVAGWAWDPTLLLGTHEDADRVARKLLGFPNPKEQRLARKRARQMDRGRKTNGTA